MSAVVPAARTRWSVVLATAATLWSPLGADGQERSGGLRVAGSSFTFARHATESSSSVYAVTGLGKVSAFAAMVHNLGTGYREVLLGVMASASYDRQAASVAVAYADAADAPYLQTYLLPRFQLGMVALSVISEAYVPIDGEGTFQGYVNPAMVLMQVRPWLAVGGAYAVGVATGRSTTHRAGPAVEVRFGPGRFAVEVLRWVDPARNEFRVTFQSRAVR